MPTHAEKATDKLRAGKWDEHKGEWVVFPDKKYYLLPVVARDQKLAPVFETDGSVSFATIYPDQQLAFAAELFMNVLTDVTEDGVVLLPIRYYSTFISLVRQLLLHFYDMTDSEIGELLTMSPNGLNTLCNDIISHLSRS